MSAQNIIEEVCESAGLDQDFVLDALIEYIDNQQDDGTFEDFLRRRVVEAPPPYNPDEDYVERCGWGNDTEHDLTRRFIDEHDLGDVYDEFMNRTAFEELLECGELGEDDDA